MRRLLIIQNTIDHFETTLSVYELARLAGYDPYVYRCPSRRKFAYNGQYTLYPDGRFFDRLADTEEKQLLSLDNLSPKEAKSFAQLTRAIKRFDESGWPLSPHAADPYKQTAFLQQHKIQIANQDVLDGADAGIVITAYPSETAKYEALASNDNPVVQRLWSKLLFISHRFGSKDDYSRDGQFLTRQNTFCLSPLSERIGVDYITPTALPIPVPDTKIGERVQLTIQAYFAKHQRELAWFFSQQDIQQLIEQRKIVVHMLGTSADVVLAGVKNVQRCANFEERMFYWHLLKNTHLILPLITPQTDSGTYATDRYSSSFNMAWGCEKPIFCHEWFEPIYNLPGIYYNENNFAEMFAQLMQLTENDYSAMVQELRARKQRITAESVEKLRAKIDALLVE